MAGTASPFSTIYAFGDSLSDAGNDSILTSATGTEPVSPPYYHTNVPILGGLSSESASVFSNGPVWVQDLSVPLGLGTLEPSLLGGNDFAYGGAETGNTPQNSGNDTSARSTCPRSFPSSRLFPKTPSRPRCSRCPSAATTFSTSCRTPRSPPLSRRPTCPTRSPTRSPRSRR